MYQLKLKIQSKYNKRRANKKADSLTRQATDTSIAWTITAWSMKVFTLVFFGAIVLFPFYFMIATATMSDDVVKDTVHSHIAMGGHWENFTRAMEDGYWKALLLTLGVTAISIVLKLMLTMLMGYAFAMNKWRFKKVLWYFFLSLLMIPEVALTVGQYKMVVTLDWQYGSKVINALFLPFIASVFSAFMFKNAFEEIPTRTKEAALVDGVSGFKYFWKIAVPMITPTTWTVAITTAFAAWNSYMWPAILLPASGDMQMMSTWVFTTGQLKDDLGNSSGTLANVRMAASLLAVTPMFIIYFLMRKRIMNAISKQGSAIKG